MRGLKIVGEVASIKGSKVLARIQNIPIGALCAVEGREIELQAQGFQNSEVVFLPLSKMTGVTSGAKIYLRKEEPSIVIDYEDPWGVFDRCGRKDNEDTKDSYSLMEYPIERLPPSPDERLALDEQFESGIKVIDGLHPIAYGQRIGIIAPPGVGKTTLIECLAKNSDVDCTVIGLIGERGREVKEFIDQLNGNLKNSNVALFVATSDSSPLQRWHTALAATRVAEYHRDQGKRVLLCVDSLTRCARAIREFTLTLGELPVRHGFTPSVYEMLPRLVERAGRTKKGSITAVYTLLSEEKGHDPLAAEVISLLDGHFILNPKLAERGIYPAIDPLRSLSRLSAKLISKDTSEIVKTFKKLWGRLENDRDLAALGGVLDPELERAIKFEEKMRNFIEQDVGIRFNIVESKNALNKTFDQ